MALKEYVLLQVLRIATSKPLIASPMAQICLLRKLLKHLFQLERGRGHKYASVLPDCFIFIHPTLNTTNTIIDTLQPHTPSSKAQNFHFHLSYHKLRYIKYQVTFHITNHSERNNKAKQPQRQHGSPMGGKASRFLPTSSKPNSPITP